MRLFEKIRTEYGLPQVLSKENGPEFLGEVITVQAKNAGMAIQYIQPGKPTRMCISSGLIVPIEEVLDRYLFTSLEHVREATW